MWEDIWDEKGKMSGTDLKNMAGFETSRPENAELTVKYIKNLMDISPEKKILEIGCGACRLGIHLYKNCQHLGVDRSPTLIEKARELIPGINVEIMDATKPLPFPDNSFDQVFIWSVLQYLPSLENAKNLARESIRISKGKVLFGDVNTFNPYTEEPTHLIIPQEFWKDNFPDKCTFLEENVYGVHKPGRYDVILE